MFPLILDTINLLFDQLHYAVDNWIEDLLHGSPSRCQ